MERDRVLLAISRIEGALARLEAASRLPRPAVKAESDPALVHRHNALRKSVEASLAELDGLIGALEK